MKTLYRTIKSNNYRLRWIFMVPLLFFSCQGEKEKTGQAYLEYEESMESPAGGLLNVILECSIPGSDTVIFRMPEWMPGYYQIMDYSDKLSA